eukprot:ANDGO_01289.mRNA.1 hypothetical protein
MLDSLLLIPGLGSRLGSFLSDDDILSIGLVCQSSRWFHSKAVARIIERHFTLLCTHSAEFLNEELVEKMPLWLSRIPADARNLVSKVSLTDISCRLDMAIIEQWYRTLSDFLPNVRELHFSYLRVVISDENRTSLFRELGQIGHFKERILSIALDWVEFFRKIHPESSGFEDLRLHDQDGMFLRADLDEFEELCQVPFSNSVSISWLGDGFRERREDFEGAVVRDVRIAEAMSAAVARGTLRNFALGITEGFSTKMFETCLSEPILSCSDLQSVMLCGRWAGDSSWRGTFVKGAGLRSLAASVGDCSWIWSELGLVRKQPGRYLPIRKMNAGFLSLHLPSILTHRRFVTCEHLTELEIALKVRHPTVDPALPGALMSLPLSKLHLRGKWVLSDLKALWSDPEAAIHQSLKSLLLEAEVGSFTEEDYRRLFTCPWLSLEDVDLSTRWVAKGTRDLLDSFLSHLDAPKLVSLQLGGFWIPSGSVQEVLQANLVRFVRLRRLRFRGFHYSAEKSLSASPGKSPSRGRPSASDEIMTALSTIDVSSLRALELVSCDVDFEKLDHATQLASEAGRSCFTNLESLSLTGHQCLKDRAFKCLWTSKAFPKLRRLHLNRNAFTLHGILSVLRDSPAPTFCDLCELSARGLQFDRQQGQKSREEYLQEIGGCLRKLPMLNFVDMTPLPTQS